MLVGAKKSEKLQEKQMKWRLKSDIKINETKTYFLEKTKLTNFWLGYKKEREKI